GPGQPFGGDDPGCVPDNAAHLRCANTIARAFGSLVSAVIRCHRMQANARLNHRAFDEESCEQATPSSGGRSAGERFNAKLSRIAPVCTSTQLVAAASLRDTLLASSTNPDSLDHLDGDVYCDSTSGAVIDDSTGGAMVDDAGFVPLNADMARCENTVGTNLARLVLRVIRCHMTLARNNFNGRLVDDESCETTAVGSYNSSADRLSARGICPPCQSNANQKALGTATVARFETANGSMYPCGAGTTTTTTVATTTTTVATTTTTVVTTTTSTTTTIPVPTTTTTTTTTTTLAPCTGPCTCTGGTPTKMSSTTGVGSGRCGHLASDTNPNFFSLACGGLYVGGAGVGVPLPVTVSADGSGTGDCSTGVITNFNLPLSSNIFLAGDLMSMRCSGGSTPGAGCAAGGGCGTVTPGSCPGGTCVNDTGRCTDTGAACCSDADCSVSATCETGACSGGTNNGKGCITSADCPGGGKCKTFIQPCPICEPTTNKCNGGPNDGLACTPVSSPSNNDFPTSHECPPNTSLSIGSLPIAFVLNTGTVTKTA